MEDKGFLQLLLLGMLAFAVWRIFVIHDQKERARADDRRDDYYEVPTGYTPPRQPKRITRYEVIEYEDDEPEAEPYRVVHWGDVSADKPKQIERRK
jgi:hypothetical protein